MALALHAVPNFLGGEISEFAQGRFDDPKYRVSLNVSLNSFPVEIGAHVRRPGTAHAHTPRGGKPAKVVRFDFEQSSPYTLEFTDGFLRFRHGLDLATTNAPQSVIGISTANPAVVNVAAALPTGATVIFPGAAANCVLLLDRQFTVTNIDGTHMSLQDAVTGANIDGSTLGTIGAGLQISQIQELQTVYAAGTWSSLRVVQGENNGAPFGVILQGTFAPQLLTVPTLQTATTSATFAISPAVFLDGPYLDPFTNGVQAVPSALLGSVTITLSFPAWSSAVAYAKGAFVTSSSVNYVSLQDQNINNTPASSPTFWQAVSGSTAIGPNGFQGTDVGRLVRLFSEPALWLTASSYTAGTVVSYNPSGVPGASTYWQLLTSSSTGHAPGSDLTNWELVPQGAAIWTWGRITGLSNIVARNPAGSSNIGSMTLDGGLAAAFNGVFSQAQVNSAANETTTSGSFPTGTVVSVSGYVGKNFGASPQVIQQATVYPSSDAGFVLSNSFIIPDNRFVQLTGVTLTVNLRASNSAPSSSSNGTLLGTITGNLSSAVTIVSNNQTTAWQYVWFEMLATGEVVQLSTSYEILVIAAQVSFFNPPGTASNSAGCTVEILGPALLYSQPILTWRWGVFSQTTGFPTCGGFSDDGRVWFGGAVTNRFDTCQSNGVSGNTINMAPTDQFGQVTDNCAISYVLNSDGVNPILWFEPDAQGMLMGTQAGEWLATAPTAGPITPTNIAARRVTRIGGAFVEPRRTDHTLVFVQRYGQKLMEDFADVFSGKFSAPNLAEKAQHLTKAGIAELAYCSAATPIIWGRCSDNSWFGVTYKRDALTTSQGPTIAAWHPHTLGSGRVVESLCGGPSVDGNLDAITMVTNDPVTNIRHVEILTDVPDETTALADCWYLDDAVQVTSMSSSSTGVTGAPYGGLTINGLWHLNGKTVQVFAGGLDCGDVGTGTYPAYSSATTYAQGVGVTVTTNQVSMNYFSLQSGNTGNAPSPTSAFWSLFLDFVVSNGSIFVPYGDGVSNLQGAGPGRGLFTAAFVATNPKIIVGFTYNSDGQLVRPIADTGARSGPAALGLQRDLHRCALLVSNSRGISVGTNFSKLDLANFGEAYKNQTGAAFGTLNTFSGIVQGTLVGNGDYDGMLCWRASRPNSPANVVALAINLEAKDQ